MPSRSFEKIGKQDLRRLAGLAAKDRQVFFAKHPDTAALYGRGPFAVALCQGAAQHYIDGVTGVKDFDVWSFYVEKPSRRFPPRRRAVADFGTPRFGQSSDSPDFKGRRVDLIGRSIKVTGRKDPISVLRAFLRTPKTLSAKLLAKKAVVLIEPSHLLGTVVWPE